MSLLRFLLVASIGSLAAGTLMVMATVLDTPVLYAPALLAILGVFVAREAWLWEGDRRGWLVMMGAILGVIAIAFLVQRVLD